MSSIIENDQGISARSSDPYRCCDRLMNPSFKYENRSGLIFKLSCNLLSRICFWCKDLSFSIYEKKELM